MYERVEQLLLEKGVNIADVSRSTGIGKSTFSGWKNGKYQPKSDKRQKVADYFGVSLAYLDGQTDDRGSSESSEPVVPVYDVAAGPGCVNGDYADKYVNAEEEEMNEYTWCEVHGDSMMPTLMSGDVVKVHIQTETDPHDLTVIKVDGESATIKHVEIVSDGIWLRADNKEVFPDKFYTVQEVLTLPITIIGKAVEFKRAL